MDDVAIQDATTTDQLVFDNAELLSTHLDLEPMIAEGIRCHGGFDSNGTYVSPRTLNRTPAIDAWQAQHQKTSGAPLVDIGLDTFGAHYPNVEQSKILLRAGIRDPFIATLTRVGTVEGFGSFLRASTVPDIQRFFDDDISATAIGHLDKGLIEAHARDEAGHPEAAEAGHNTMWFIARDIAFEHPMTDDLTSEMLFRMGITPAAGVAPDFAALRANAIANRVLPVDIDFDLESLLNRMVRLLLIEISAFHTFTWAETLLSDDNLVAGEGRAAAMVNHIRADETPHVRYLTTVLSEIREHTIVGADGHKHPGADVIDALWAPAVAQSRGEGRSGLLDLTWAEIVRSLDGRSGADDLLAEFDAAGTSHRQTNGTWIDPSAGEIASLDATSIVGTPVAP